uniref:Glycosyltransferases n=1 Tax=Leersia perrieri TaxID=77586 RepID=A0A0D9UWZ5_9ORYZ
MDTSEEVRSKKRLQLWSTAIVHFSICFIVGVFAAAVMPLAATGAPPIDSIRASFQPTAAAATPPPSPDLLLIVTVTRPHNDDDVMSQEASLMRLGHTLRLVAPPLLWIVVGARNTTATARAVHALRGSRVMFRHLTYDAENFTGLAGDEVEYQRNLALSHIQLHRLPGIVHFAGAGSVYDLRFFEQLRRTRGIAAWPIGIVSSADQTVAVEGPTCNSSQITGWYSKDSNTTTETIWEYSKDSSSNTTEATWESSSNTTETNLLAALDTNVNSQNSSSRPLEINISGVGFKSSLLWDSERFIHRDNSSTGINKDLIQFVRQTVIANEDKKRGIPSDCSESQIMLWSLDMPRHTPKIEEHETPEKEILMKGDKFEEQETPEKEILMKGDTIEEQETPEKESLKKGDKIEGQEASEKESLMKGDKIEEQETSEKERLMKERETLEKESLMKGNKTEEHETPEKEILMKGSKIEEHETSEKESPMKDDKIEEQETPEKERLMKGDKTEEQETPEKESVMNGDKEDPMT